MKLLGDIEAPEVTIRESPGHFEEFVAAIKGGDPAVSNFADYASPLTEMVLLGNLAVWAADSGSGPKIEWDAKNLAAKNVPNLEKLIKPEYRQGYSTLTVTSESIGECRARWRDTRRTIAGCLCRGERDSLGPRPDKKQVHLHHSLECSAMSSNFKNTRRGFIQTTAALGVGYWVAGRANGDDAAPTERAAEAPSDKVQFACIGVGGKGESDSNDAGRLGQRRGDLRRRRRSSPSKAAQRFPDAKKFYDFRDLFDEMSGQIDAVTVSTPDHTHAPAAIRAMKEGKAVFCQKPLTHSLWEARRMAEVAREMKVATQMGNQGTAESGLRRSAAIIQAGTLGSGAGNSRLDEPADLAARRYRGRKSKPVPKNLHWNLWLGPAAEARLRRRLSSVRLARLVGFWHRCAGRHGLSHDEHAVHGARPARSGVGDGRDLRSQQRELSQVVDHSVRIRRQRQAAGRQADLVRRRQAASVGIAGRGGDQR